MSQDPQSNWNVIGHQTQVALLQRVLAADTVNHAYVFAGPDHIGKATVARLFLADLLDVAVDTLDRHPDAVWIRREVNPKTKKLRERISVDQVQEARHRFSQSALIGGYKVLLVEDAHLLSDAAANALLKTLEEPRGKACIILTARHERLLLPTLRSRSHIIPFQLVSTPELTKVLEERSAENAPALARRSLGAPGLALAALQDVEAAEQLTERTEKARACLDASLHKRILAARELLPAYQDDHVVTRTELLSRITTLEVLARDQLLAAMGCQDLGSGDVQESLTAQQATRALKGINETRTALLQHLNPKVSLINLMLTIA